MDTQMTGHPAAAWTASFTQALLSSAAAVRSAVMRFDTWVAMHARRADDRAALDAMSDRELRDIGLPARGVELVSHWTRELPL